MVIIVSYPASASPTILLSLVTSTCRAKIWKFKSFSFYYSSGIQTSQTVSIKILHVWNWFQVEMFNIYRTLLGWPHCNSFFVFIRVHYYFMGEEIWKLTGSLKLVSLIPVRDFKRQICISYHRIPRVKQNMNINTNTNFLTYRVS